MEAHLEDELVALDPHAGKCFGFNAVATSVWRLLREPQSFARLSAALRAEYDVEGEQCDRELAQLLKDMVAKGLVSEEQPKA